MYTDKDFAPLITKHDIKKEAEFLAKMLNQDIWVIERLLREYWKDKLAIEWTVNDIMALAISYPNFSKEDAIEILRNTSYDYVKDWGIDKDDIVHSIEIYEDYKKGVSLDDDIYTLYPQG